MSAHHLGEELLAMAEGGGALSEARRHELHQHLGSCSACQAAVAETQRVLAMVEKLPSLEPSPAFARALSTRLDQLDAEAEDTFWARLKAALTLPRLAGAMALAAAVVLGVLLLKPAPEPNESLEVLEFAEHLELYQDLELLEDLDVLEDLEAIEALEAGEPG